MDQFVSGSAARKYKLARDYCKKEQILIKSSAMFIGESLKFIQSMVRKEKLSQERGHRYMKEILHCIFFHCHIYRPPIHDKQSIYPKEIQSKLLIHPVNVLREDLHSKLSKKFPDVFQSYTSQLPRRSPFSILLEVVVETTAERSETAILRELARLNDQMIIKISDRKSSANDFCFAAAVVSCSGFERSDLVTQEYFGASMSCKGPITTMIFISVACIETWNDNVAHGVCLAANGHRSITLPDTVWSRAHRLRSPREGGNNSHTYKARSPCLWCKNTFPNVTFSPIDTAQNEPTWQCGNCAECEAISNLLNGETSVSEETQQLNTGLEPSLMTLREERERKLTEHLEELNFNLNPATRFYNP
nr:uncharacterized protein LOC111857175 isoform X2 [Paramormyrops kingsleyae]